jgi:hypothetical protein
MLAISNVRQLFSVLTYLSKYYVFISNIFFLNKQRLTFIYPPDTSYNSIKVFAFWTVLLIRRFCYISGVCQFCTGVEINSPFKIPSNNQDHNVFKRIIIILLLF